MALGNAGLGVLQPGPIDDCGLSPSASSCGGDELMGLAIDGNMCNIIYIYIQYIYIHSMYVYIYTVCEYIYIHINIHIYMYTLCVYIYMTCVYYVYSIYLHL